MENNTYSFLEKSISILDDFESVTRIWTIDCSVDDKYPVWIPELFGRFQLTTNLGDLESIFPNLKKKKNIRENT